MAQKTSMYSQSDDPIDSIVNEIMQNPPNKKKIYFDPEQKIDLNKDDFESLSLDNSTKKALKELSTLPNYYKILGVNPSENCKTIKKIGNEKLQIYHPDKIEPLLLKVLPSEKENERKKLLIQYNMIYEATKTLSNEDKRKLYDIELKTINNKDIISQRASFQEFIKAQNSELSKNPKDKEMQQMKFIAGCEELNKKHGVSKKDLESPGLSKHITDKKLADLKIQRETQDLELTHKNIFKNKDFDLDMFNEKWDLKQSKSQSQTKLKNNLQDKSLIKWDGISASNDTGSSVFAPVSGDYDALYAEVNFADSSAYANVLDSQSDVSSENYDLALSDDNIGLGDGEPDPELGLELDLHLKYRPKSKSKSKSKASGSGLSPGLSPGSTQPQPQPQPKTKPQTQPLSKPELEKLMNSFKSDRENDLKIQEHTKVSEQKYWKNYTENPMNISSQIGNFDAKLLTGASSNSFASKSRSRITGNQLDAYKSLINENSD